MRTDSCSDECARYSSTLRTRCSSSTPARRCLSSRRASGRWIWPAGESSSPWGSQTRNSPAVRIDVFTLVPHAYAWLTEQRPVASVLGTELELRLVNYRDSTPLRAGQVDDEPYGGGAGMVLRVDVVAAALEAAYGGEPPGPVIALTPKGRPLTQAIVEELAALPALTLHSSRFEGFDERIVEHLATDAISVGPYVLSNGDLPAMIVLDAVARPLPGALAECSGELESFSAHLGGGLEYPRYTRPCGVEGWAVRAVVRAG